MQSAGRRVKPARTEEEEEIPWAAFDDKSFHMANWIKSPVMKENLVVLMEVG